ncbi:PKD domain-containing protein [Botryobacter ruber]|uniref:PKD domain-containing protein n=1 Tax=Botryobacter ruber TaxID=2171629 RepID=UPI0013E2D468|nr:PKD domain-containing protein [Botryobacter ruber]
MHLLLLVFCAQAWAQNTSNKGKDFWIAYMGHIDGQSNSNAQSKLSLYVTSDVTTTGTVAVPGIGFVQNFTVTANNVTIINIPQAAYIGNSEVVENKGIHVTAEEPVVVYSHIYANARSAATLALPTNTMGREYYAMSIEQKNTNNLIGYSELVVVGVEDDTEVEIELTAESFDKKQQPGVPFTVKLNQGEVYQVRADAGKDLTGSRIRTLVTPTGGCKKVAVFSGSSFTGITSSSIPTCPASGSGDNLYQQLYPLSAWGKNYITAPFKTRTAGDIYRIMAGAQATRVSINGNTVVLNPGQVHEFVSTTGNYISADQPVTVAQYATTQTCDRNGVVGDPDMVILNPLEQTLTNITLYSSPFQNITGQYINVLMKTANTGLLRLDGQPVTQWTPIPSNPAYSYTQADVAAGNHTLAADSGFSAIAYGFANVESYAYSAGANLKDLTKYIVPQPVAGPQYSTGCENKGAIFKVVVPYTPTFLQWDFGDDPDAPLTDGDLATLSSPAHVYTTKGSYTIKAIIGKPVSNDCDTQDELTFTFDVFPNPEAAFGAAEACARNEMHFEDKSVAAIGTTITKWEWEFEPGKTATERHPKHTFEQPGVYPVTLKVTTSGGCTATSTQEVTVRPLPVPAFTAEPVCETLAAAFTNASAVAEGSISRYEWNFGDPASAANTSTATNPSHNFTKAGTFRVILKAYSDKGCVDSVAQNIIIYPKPIPAYTLPEICLRDEAAFVNESTIESGTMTYLWDFGDGTTSTERNPKHRYSEARLYKVKLTVTSDKGCVASKETDYVVSGAEPEAKFSASSFCQKDAVTFKDESTLSFGTIKRWEWDFGDGSTSDEQHPTHLYTTPGLKTVKLTVYSGGVCFSTTTQQLTIIPSPTAAFTTANVCLEEPALITQASTMTGGTIASYTWDFGDGTSPVAVTTPTPPRHVYQAAGTYQLKLTVTAGNGCTDMAAGEITVYPRPAAAFTAANFCEKDVTAFTDGSTLSSGAISSWLWEFGDGSTSTQQHPRYTYKSPGTFIVKLTVRSDNNCTASATSTVTISAQPRAKAGPDQLDQCGSRSTTLQAEAPAVGAGTWSMVSGSGGTIHQPDQHNSSFSGQPGEQYTLRWTVRNGTCPDATDEVLIRFNPLPFVSAGADLEVLEGESISLEGSGDGTYLWEPAEGLSNPRAANPSASPTETTVYKLTMTTAAGCTASDKMQVTVLPRLKIPNAFSPNNDGINDTWVLYGISAYPQASIQVFDRWGSLVYDGGFDQAWDGRHNGRQLPMGTYFYIIKPNSKHKPMNGTISIVR